MYRQTYFISFCIHIHIIELERPEECCAVKKAGSAWKRSFDFQPGGTLVPASLVHFQHYIHTQSRILILTQGPPEDPGADATIFGRFITTLDIQRKLKHDTWKKLMVLNRW